VITVGDDGAVEPPPETGEPPVPTHPIVLPPDSDLKPEHPIVLPPEEGEGPHPEHPIVLPPLGIWPSPPEGSVLPEHPIVLPPESIPGLPTHPIVIPPGLGDDFWTGNLPPFNHPEPVE